MSTAEQLGEVQSAVADQTDNVIPIFADQHPPEEGVFNSLGQFLSTARAVGEATVTNTVGNIRDFAHELMHGDYSEKFKREFALRHVFETSEGVLMTARILNPEFLDENNPEADDKAILYSFSLLVPAKHGVELPTVTALAAHGEETGRSVIVITTEGLSGPLNRDQLSGLTDFWKMPKRRFEVLREIFPLGKKIIATGASLGGMMSHAMARTWEQEAEESGVTIEITHDFAVASAGHFELPPTEYPRLFRQALHEAQAVGEYIWEGENGWVGKAQRFFELVGTLPRYPSQWLAIGAVGLGIRKAPLAEVHNSIPPNVDVREYTFNKDEVTHPRRRLHLVSNSNHPKMKHEQAEGSHLALLTKGKEWTLQQLKSVARRKRPTAA